MVQNSEFRRGEEWVSLALSAIERECLHELENDLSSLSDTDLANLLESLPPEQRAILWNWFPEPRKAGLLTHLHDEVRASIIDTMAEENIVSVVQAMPAEDMAEVIDELPADVSETILDSLDADNRARVERVLAYEHGTAGRLMSLNVLSVGPKVTLGDVLRWLRRQNALPINTDALMVVNDEGRYLGKLMISAIVTGDPALLVEQRMDEDTGAISVNTAEHDVIGIFDRRELISIAVVDEAGLLIGRITFDDVIDVLKEEADHALLKSAGLTEDEDLFAAALPSAKRRGIWLGINLVTVFLAAWVVSQFEAVLGQLVALAILMPVVASMGGIAGSQTLTLTIRGMALDQIASGNVRWLTRKEVTVGILNGAVWALVVSVLVYLWFENAGLALVIAAALMLNLFVAALCGVGIPLILKRAGADPALSGAVILTTVTDVVGFFSFLGLASLFLT